MKALVTGGAGFIGSHIVDLLVEDNWDVIVVDNFYSGRQSNLENAQKLARKKGSELKVIRADISKASTWQDLPHVDSCFHLAAQTSVTRSVENEQINFDWNVKAYAYISKWAIEKKVKTFVYANTAGALYGEGVSIPTKEDSKVLPSSPYGASKYFTELMLYSTIGSLKQAGKLSSDPKKANFFSWAAIRLANVYGPRQITKGEAGVIPIFCDLLLAGKTPVVFGSGSETRDYVHVKDVARAFFLANQRMQSSSIDGAFNVGTSVETKTDEVYQHVLAEFKRQGLVANQHDKPLRAPLRPGELKNSAVSHEKISKDLGWEPEHDFNTGVQETVAYYLEHEASKALKKAG